MSYKIIDNFLPEDEFYKLKDNLLDNGLITWTFNNGVNGVSTDPWDFQFTHLFYQDGRRFSDNLFLLDPILNRLNPSALLRIKANLQTKTPEIVVNGFHHDHPQYNGKIAVFYVNTNNGYTMFEDGTRVESIENRLLVFNGNMLHTGATCTDQKVRCVINFMFYQWTDSELWKL